MPIILQTFLLQETLDIFRMKHFIFNKFKTNRALSLSPFMGVMEKSAGNATFKEFLELLLWDFCCSFQNMTTLPRLQPGLLCTCLTLFFLQNRY